MWLIKYLEYCAMIITLIGIYPLYKEFKKYRIKIKDQITDYTFTDRIDDVKDIINILNSGEKFIAIIGTNDIQGKTWLSKKICDCINHASVLFEYGITRCKIKRAFYFNLTNRTIDLVEKELLEYCVNSSTLCVFDNCELNDITAIKNKSLALKFSSIIIPSQVSDINKFDIKKYKLSPFPIKKINELQTKIVEKFPEIDYLSKEEIDTLYNLTNGNIKKIYSILNSQKTILWIKQISKNQKTDYDVKLSKIQILLFEGLYKEAETEINKLYLEDNKILNINNDYFVKFILIESDCQHLLNNYNKAIDKINILLLDNQYDNYNKNNIFELKLAHFYKHIWESDKSLNILHRISNTNCEALMEMLGVLSCKYFINENVRNFNNLTTLNLYNSLINKISYKNIKDFQRLERHKIIMAFYNNNSTLTDLIPRIDNVIKFYKFENNRLVANAVFLKGELYRLNKEYDKAIACYIDTLTYTDDDNIRIQVNIMLYYLNKIKKINLTEKYMSINEVILLCHTHNNNYGMILIRKINSIKLRDPGYEKIIKYFENRIMTIL